MAYRYGASQLFVIDIDDGRAHARVWHDASLERAEVFRLHQELQRRLSALSRADPGVTGALILDLTDADVVGHPRLRASFATALQSWELAHRPVGVVQAAPSVHLIRIAATVAPHQSRVVEAEADARAWIDVACALRAIPAASAF